VRVARDVDLGAGAGGRAGGAPGRSRLGRGRADSLVYPLARGTGPLLSGAAAIVFLGERPSALALAGALIIVGAVFSLAGWRGTREAVVLAVLTGVAIANYTIVLRRGIQWDVRRAAGVGLLSPLAYVLVLFALARAPVSIVAPARETSILLGTLLGTTVLAEGQRLRRLCARARSWWAWPRWRSARRQREPGPLPPTRRSARRTA
jgi:drug/metabolite transporter (DMT)-like permease